MCMGLDMKRSRLCNACWAVEGRQNVKKNTAIAKKGEITSKKKENTNTNARKKPKPGSLVVYLHGPAVQSVRSPGWIVQIASAFAKKFWDRSEMFDPFPFEHNPVVFDCLVSSEWYRPGLKTKTYAYCNPPYAELKVFVHRMVQMWREEGIPSVALIPHRMHRQYLSIHYGSFPILPVNGGVRFLDRDYKPYRGVLPEGVCLMLVGPITSPMFGVVWNPQDAKKPTNVDSRGIAWRV